MLDSAIRAGALASCRIGAEYIGEHPCQGASCVECVTIARAVLLAALPEIDVPLEIGGTLEDVELVERVLAKLVLCEKGRMPKRIQRKRTKGWRMPAGAVYVGRPTKWGNPFQIGKGRDANWCVERYRKMVAGNIWTFPSAKNIRDELRGADLCCWCPLDQPCHADVLLEIANAR